MALIAHYRLDGDADDALGRHHGVASAVTWVDGKLGKAAGLSGQAGISLGEIPGLQPFAVFSIAGWAKFNGTGQSDTDTLVSVSTGYSSTTFAVDFYQELLRFLTYDEVGSSSLVTTGDYPRNEWFHFSVVHTGTHNRIYVNGVLKGSVVAASPRTDISNAWIGSRGAERALIGDIQDIRIYDHALSKHEVKDLAKGCLSYYRLDGTTKDAIGTGTISIGAGTFVDSEIGTVADVTGTVATVPLEHAPLDLKGETITFLAKCGVDRASVGGGMFSHRIVQWGTYHDDNSGGVGIISGVLVACLRGPNGSGWTNTHSSGSAAAAIYDQGGWIRYTVVFREDDTFAVFMNATKVFDIALSDPYTGLGTTGVQLGASMQAQVSDLRIIRTALTEDQVTRLATCRASLDAQGNFYASLFSEVQTSHRISKAGEVAFDGFSEIGITDGLAAYYPLTKDAKDYSGNGYDGVVNGAVPVGGGFDGKGAFRFVKKALNFISIDYDLRSTWTYSCWARHNQVNYFAFLGQGPRTKHQGLHILVLNATTLKFGIYSGDRLATNLPTNSNQWYHYVFVYDHDTFEKQIWRDGIRVDNADETPPAQYNGTGPTRIGAIYTNSPDAKHYADGEICNVKIFNRALSPEEIAIEYKRTGPAKMTQYAGRTYIQGQFKEVTA